MTYLEMRAVWIVGGYSESPEYIRAVFERYPSLVWC